MEGVREIENIRKEIEELKGKIKHAERDNKSESYIEALYGNLKELRHKENILLERGMF